VDDHAAGVEVDILPTQREQLAEAQAGVGGEAEQLCVLGVLARARSLVLRCYRPGG
jgi:hypothetical protein